MTVTHPETLADLPGTQLKVSEPVRGDAGGPSTFTVLTSPDRKHSLPSNGLKSPEFFIILLPRRLILILQYQSQVDTVWTSLKLWHRVKPEEIL